MQVEHSIVWRLNRKYIFDQSSTKGPRVSDMTRVPEASVSKVRLKSLSVKLVDANLWISIFAFTKVYVQLPKTLTGLFSFIVTKRACARFQCAFARYRVRSNGDTLCRRCLDILSIEFVVCTPFQCEIIPLSTGLSLSTN